MRVQATRTVSGYALAAAFLTLVFLVVVVAQVAVVSALRGAGFDAGSALSISGAVIFASVIGLAQGRKLLHARAIAARERARIQAGLPEGACCVVWRGGSEAEFPWELEGQVVVRYPRVARRLGVEGYAVVDFEVGANGMAKNPHLVDVWPSRIFYDAALEALKTARFRLRDQTQAWQGPSYRMPFVFRIEGAAQVRDKGKRAWRRGSLLWLIGLLGKGVPSLRLSNRS